MRSWTSGSLSAAGIVAWTKGTSNNLRLKVCGFKREIREHEHAHHFDILPHLCFKWEE